MQTNLDSTLDKGRELFALCDQEGKGFITRNDLTRLGNELPLTGEQLAAVFDGLDEDGNGYLTLNEFLEGFADYMAILQEAKTKTTDKEISAKAEDDHFEILLDHLEARNLFGDEEMIRVIYNHLKRQDATLVLEFETFIGKISSELKRNLSETATLQSVLQSKTNKYEEHIKKLYEEMEFQIRTEKEKILNEERQRERRLRDELELQLDLKDQQLQDLMAKQSEMVKKLESLNYVEVEAKQSTDRLTKQKESLEQQLIISQEAIEELQNNLDFVRQQTKEDKRRRAKTAMNMSESIALEREELVKQLDLLKAINKQLQDEKDEHLERFSQTQSVGSNEKMATGDILLFSPTDSGLGSQGSPAGSRLLKRGSVLSDYIFSRSPGGIQSPFTMSMVSTDDGLAWDRKRNGRPKTENGAYPSLGKTSSDSYRSYAKPDTDPIFGEISTPAFNPLMEEFLCSQPAASVTTTVEEDEEELWNIDMNKRNQRKPFPLSSSSEQCIPKKLVDPQRVFKVVFIGDSGVGKSSFIHRFCNNAFKASFSTTIGVDFQIKHVNCDGQTVVMQLWDTAGQERFRSITHQYMRKADGVVIVYDVTSETSFKNVRNWMTCVQDVAEEDTVILLVGNKIDMCSSSSQRAVKTGDGMRLAEECYGLFFETSVKESVNVVEAMEELAKRLREKQDLEIEKSLQLHLRARTKKRCCS